MPKISPAFRFGQRGEVMRRSASSAMQWSGMWGSSSKCGSWRAVDCCKAQQVMRPRCMMNSHLVSLALTSWTGCLKGYTDTLHVSSWKIGPVLVISRTTAEPRPETFLTFAQKGSGRDINWASWRQEPRRSRFAMSVGFLEMRSTNFRNRAGHYGHCDIKICSRYVQAVLQATPNPADIWFNCLKPIAAKTRQRLRWGDGYLLPLVHLCFMGMARIGWRGNHAVLSAELDSRQNFVWSEWRSIGGVNVGGPSIVQLAQKKCPHLGGVN